MLNLCPNPNPNPNSELAKMQDGVEGFEQSTAIAMVEQELGNDPNPDPYLDPDPDPNPTDLLHLLPSQPATILTDYTYLLLTTNTYYLLPTTQHVLRGGPICYSLLTTHYSLLATYYWAHT